MLRMTRRIALASLSAFAITACGAADSGNAQTSGTESDEIALTDITQGDADAPITMVEYASWTCPACLQFHSDVVPMLRSDYIETGKVRFVFREFPTAPINVSVAGFALARCSGEDSYYDMIDDLFAAQSDIIGLIQNRGDVAGALRGLAAGYDLDGDAFETCLNNKDVSYAITEAVMKGDSQGVNSTPTVFVNGERLTGYEWRSADGMRAVLDAKLDALGASDASAE